MTKLRWINLTLAFLATLAPLAHVLELPNKLALDGPLWLAIQQHLYRGWGPVVGAPTEIGALATSLLLLVPRYRGRMPRSAAFTAVACYAGMLAVFFVFNGPVNAALSGWTAATLPPDWMDYRMRWETGHAIAAGLSIVAVIVLLRAALRDAASRQIQHDRDSGGDNNSN